MNETPMQQLADKIKASIDNVVPIKKDLYDLGYKTALESVLSDIEMQMLPIEKEYLSNIKPKTN
jgi:hypothetical protein